MTEFWRTLRGFFAFCILLVSVNRFLLKDLTFLLAREVFKEHVILPSSAAKDIIVPGK